MMKATELLVREHQSIRVLLAECEDASCRIEAGSARAIARLAEALLLHDKIEEEIFYPSLIAAYSAGPDSPVEQAGDEHQQIKQLLREVAEINPADKRRRDAAFKLMKEAAEKHFEREEAELIPAAERDLSEERLTEIGVHLEARKRQLESELKTDKP
jgi:hemerythrin-like domain-containing protein